MDKYILKTMEKDAKYLRQTSCNVEKNNVNLKKYVNVLKNYCENNEVFAMASVQLGIPLKIIYLKNAELDNTGSSTNEGLVLINPEIIEEKGKTYYWEACWSERVLAKVYRPYYIKMKYFNQNFEEKIMEFEGMHSTVISHEYDHLFGIIHTDIAEEVSDYPFEDRKKFRKQNGYTVISKTCDYNHPIRDKKSYLFRLRTIENDESYLRQVSKDVLKGDIELKQDIENLSDFCKTNDVLAMAAVQIGIPKKIIYLKNTNDKDLYNEQIDEEKIMINPVILKEKGETYYWEACASCLDNMGHVKRPYEIEISYFDENFNKHNKTLTGFEATVFSHEYDHMYGILHVDIADEIKIMEANERKVFREKEENGYVILSKVKKYKHPLR